MIMRLAPIMVFFVLVAAFLVLLTRPQDQDVERDAVMRPAPVLNLQAFDGKPVSLPQGQWVLVNFFASWCVPCVMEHPQLMEIRKELTVIGIAYRDSQDNITHMLEQRGNPYAAVAADGKGVAALAFGISGVPESFLINPAGQIVHHLTGPILHGQQQEILNARR